MKDNIKISKKDWKYIQSALICFELDSFQSHELQLKIMELLDRYS